MIVLQPRPAAASGTGDTAHQTPAHARRMVLSAAALTVVIAVVGWLLARGLVTSGVAQPSTSNIFFRLYALFERPYLVLLAIFAAVTVLIVMRVPHRAQSSTSRSAGLAAPGRVHIALVAFAVLLAGVATSNAVMQGLLFSMDEFSAQFQAEIFARGQYAATVPPPWRSMGAAIAPVFVRFDERSGQMMSMYLPVYSALKAPFVLLSAAAWLNPVLSALSILVLASLARRLWPTDGERQWTAIALLATSSQVIATSGTGYAMPAHLLLNLVWLHLYLRDDPRSWCAALLVGFLELGLHNPFPHALFVAPFLLTLLKQRRWGRVISAALVYCAAGAFWLAWLRVVNPATGAVSTGLLTLFTLPDLGTLALHIMNVSLILTWHAPVFAILLLVALSHPQELPAPLREIALGLVFTFGFFMLYPNTQGHGWGYRYVYQLLGGLAVLGAAAVPTVRSTLGDRWTARWLVAGFAIALLIQLPLRLSDIRGFVLPFATGYQFARSRDATVVLLHGDSVWYGRDIIRNDPYLTPPILVRAGKLSPDAVQALLKEYPHRVVDLPDREFLRLGMTPQLPHD